jgi:hypothetical protein
VCAGYLGRALALVERGHGPGRGKKALSSLTSLLKSLGLTKPTALEAQRLDDPGDESS